jgi:hypothetical protein
MVKYQATRQLGNAQYLLRSLNLFFISAKTSITSSSIALRVQLVSKLVTAGMRAVLLQSQ